MSNRSITQATGVQVRPNIAARTRLLLEGPSLSTLLRLSAPNVLNLLAIAGMINFDGLFLGRLGSDALAGVSLAFPFVMLMQHTAASGMVVASHQRLLARSVPANVTLPMPLSCTLSFWRWDLRQHSRWCCCSLLRLSFVGWAGRGKSSQLRLLMRTWRSVAPSPFAC